MGQADADTVYAAKPLLTALCELAADRDPSRVTVPLATTAADRLGLDLPGNPPVFTHFYLPDTGRSVSAVFGVDLGTPPGASPGLFVSHPDGRTAVSRRDDLREVVFVAVPPWRSADVRAYDRRGRRRPLERLAVSPPDESPP